MQTHIRKVLPTLQATANIIPLQPQFILSVIYCKLDAPYVGIGNYIRTNDYSPFSIKHLAIGRAVVIKKLPQQIHTILPKILGTGVIHQLESGTYAMGVPSSEEILLEQIKMLAFLYNKSSPVQRVNAARGRTNALLRARRNTH